MEFKQRPMVEHSEAEQMMNKPSCSYRAGESIPHCVILHFPWGLETTEVTEGVIFV